MNELIPVNPIALDKWEDSLGTMDKLEQQIVPLSTRAKEIKVVDADSFAEAGAIIADLKRISKESEACMAPYKIKVRQVLDFIQTRFTRNKNHAEMAHAVLTVKMAEYSRKEKEATAKEQKQMERKGIEGTVQPNLPKVAGVRSTVNYPISIEDPKALIRACLKAYKASDTKRFQFLAQFIMLDEAALRAHAKEIKNVEQFAKDCPGVTCKESAAFGGKV